MAILILMAGILHPFHLSVTNIYFKPKEKVVQVEQRLFLDDLEEALKDYTDNIYLNLSDDDQEEVKALLAKYLSENFWIESRGKKIPLEYLGHEFELKENVVWCYFEAQKVKKFESFSVKNKLLLEKFDDQENIIHYTDPEGNKRSERTGIKNSMAYFE